MKASSMKHVGVVVGPGVPPGPVPPALHSALVMPNAPPGYCGAAPFMREGQPAAVQQRQKQCSVFFSHVDAEGQRLLARRQASKRRRRQYHGVEPV